MMKILQRPVQKGDVQYTATGGPPFVATVTLATLPGKPSFDGHACGKKADSEQSAASRAMHAAETLTRLRSESASNFTGQSVPSTNGSSPPAVREENHHSTNAAQSPTHQPEPRPSGFTLQQRQEETGQETQEPPATAQEARQAAHQEEEAAEPSINHQQSTPPVEASTSSTMCIREWCTLQQLPDCLADRLAEEDFQSPGDLTELSEADLDELCAGLKLGHKGRFKRCVKALR
mmetsp:Transcript_117739/g.191662  ORF Transcript_117739/g.191662 Transcript_117739/m.191662 type:complete len:234 (-) Transcript_117739:38-739(-)